MPMIIGNVPILLVIVLLGGSDAATGRLGALNAINVNVDNQRLTSMTY